MDHEDLTASHWDDVISPHSEYTYNATSSPIAPLNNQFSELSVDDSEDNEEDDEEDDEEEEDDDKEEDEMQKLQTSRHGYSNPIDEQRDELEKDKRNDHKHKLLSELTHGSEENQLESFIKSPDHINPSESLFNEKDSPIKPSTSVSNEQPVSPKRVPNLKTSKYKPTRLRKFSSKTIVQHLGNENNTKELLGPLGEPTGTTIDKESVPSSSNGDNLNNNNKDLLVQQLNAPLYDIDNGTKNETPHKIDQSIQKSASNEDSSVAHTMNAPSNLEISVGDPMKVGDITNAHIVYSIKTKNKKLDSQLLPQGTDTFIVSRRYKDFRWIYHQLQNNHPGKIIPPPPTKQTYIGRFNENFIENRRLSLEKMLNKISHSSSLQEDSDFIMFLVSEDFGNESKEREKLSGSGASLQNDEFLDNESNTSNTDSTPVTVGSNAGGFMSSIFSMSQKIEEPDEYFIQKKEYIESLEHNLRVFYKSIELINNQRQEMAGLVDEISLTIDELASLEILKITTDLLSSFSDVQLKLKENLDRINLQDQLTLGFTIEEYLRIIGSIKYVFDSRSKIYQQYYNFNQEYIKKQAQLHKLNKKFKVQNDKANNLNFEVDKLRAKVQTFEKKFNLISETIKSELERFEFEKIDDFRNSVEIFIESSIESQKEAIELWETFYERENLSKI